jgi:inositol oxygenase
VLHCRLNKARLSLWDALLLLDDVPPVAAALCAGAPGAPPVRHLAASLAAAAAAMQAHPDAPWLAFVALTHALGRLLLLPRFGGEPAWSVVGDTFPVGCRFDPSVSYAACFGANPDRRKRAYASPTGVYAPGCGLSEVDMCWSCDEYLLEVLARNRAALPPAGLFCVRYASFASLGGAAVGYNALLTPAERDSLPWLHDLRRVKRDAAAASDAALGPHPDARAALRAMEHVYRPLIDQFCPGELCW